MDEVRKKRLEKAKENVLNIAILRERFENIFKGDDLEMIQNVAAEEQARWLVELFTS